MAGFNFKVVIEKDDDPIERFIELRKELPRRKKSNIVQAIETGRKWKRGKFIGRESDNMRLL